MLRILVANEPDLPREALARTLAALRPDALILLAQPEELEAAILRDAPDVIICSRAIEMLTTHADRWIVLHPGGASASLIGARGTWQIVGELPLATILGVIDLTAREVASFAH